jgi:hypothetical protein
VLLWTCVRAPSLLLLLLLVVVVVVRTARRALSV